MMKKTTFNLLKLTFIGSIVTLFLSPNNISAQEQQAFDFNGNKHAIKYRLETDAYPFDPTDPGLADLTRSSLREGLGNFTWEMAVNGVSDTNGYLYSEGWSGGSDDANGYNRELGVYSLEADGAGKLRVIFQNAAFDGVYDDGQILLDVTSSSTVFDGSWHSIALVGNNAGGFAGAANVTLYIDGVADANINSSPYVFPNSWGSGSVAGKGGGDINRMAIGAVGIFAEEPNNFGHYYNGKIDEVKIWSIARTLAEITGDSKCNISAPTANLHIYQKFDETTGNSFANKAKVNGSTQMIPLTDTNGEIAPFASQYDTTYDCTASLGIEDSFLQDIIVYVDTDFIRVKNNSSNTVQNARLYDIYGRNIASSKTNNINVNGMVTGVYIISLQFDNGSILNKKLIINY